MLFIITIGQLSRCRFNYYSIIIMGLTQLAVLGQSERVQGSVAVQDHGELGAAAHLHHRSAAVNNPTVY